METTRQSILDHASRLAVSQGEVPSLNALAASVGISKGGLMHHFPTRNALLTELVVNGINEVDTAMQSAAQRNEVLKTWLNLSIPSESGLALFQAMASLVFAGKSGDFSIRKLSWEASQRWETLLTNELGGAQAGLTALILGDGLLFGSISGTITMENASDYLVNAESAVSAVVKAS